MSQTNARLRLAVIGAIVVALFAGLVTRLWFLQVAGGERLAVQAQRNTEKIVAVPALRGRILDAQGRVLAEDAVVDAIMVDRQKLTPAKRATVVAKLAELLGRTPESIAAAIDTTKYSSFQAVPVAVDVGFEQILMIKEHPDDYPYVEVTRTTVRRYPQGTLAAHLVGYTAQISPDEIALRKNDDYQEDDKIGKTGVEQAFEYELRGKPELQKIEVDSQNRIVKVSEARAAVPGHDVVLTVDLDVQRIAETALQQGMEGARKVQNLDQKARFETFKGTGGAVVVLDARTGSVVSLASSPTYDPNTFATGVVPAGILDPANNFPLIDRAMNPYAPGSTFKAVSAIAGLQQDFIAPGTTIYDDGCFEFGNDEERCNARKQANGQVDLGKALVVSSDVYFYSLGNEIWNVFRGESRNGDTAHERGYALQHTAKEFGFGTPTGIGLAGDQPGRVPDEAFNKMINKDRCDDSNCTWRRGDSASLAVGQGDLLVTPLQLAGAYAAIANGGTLYTPRIATAITENSTGMTGNQKPANVRALDALIKRKTNLTPEMRDAVLAGLRGVVNSETGTAYFAFQGFRTVPVAGKTGTAQRLGKQDTSWFAAITNPDNDPSLPQYVVVAMVEEGGFGSDVAAPIARRVIEKLAGNPAPAPVLVPGSSSGRRD